MLIDNSRIRERKGTKCLCYSFDDSLAINIADYKILHNQSPDWWIRSFQSRLNGKAELVCVTEGLVPFADAAASMQKERLVSAIAALCMVYGELARSSFLDAGALVLDADRTYYDRDANVIKLIYIPVLTAEREQKSAFYKDFYKYVLSLLDLGEKAAGFYFPLLHNDRESGAALMPEEIASEIRREDVPARDQRGQDDEDQVTAFMYSSRAGRTLVLTGIGPNSSLSYKVDKEQYVIGRSKSRADGVIPDYLDSVGRVHCRIDKAGNNFSVTDLRSLNGTYVNNIRLKEKDPCPLVNGDRLRLANTEFIVKIGEGE